MKILQVNKAYYPHLGGVETVVKQLAEGFAASPGVESSEVLACSDEWRTRHEIVAGVPVTYAATLARVASLPVSPSFPVHLARRSADILQMHEPSLVPPASYLALGPLRRRRFRRLVVWWHSEIVRQKLAQPIYKPLLNWLLGQADAVIVSSPHLPKTSPILAPYAHKCRVVHLGIDPARFDETPEMTARAARLRAPYGDKPIVLFTGRLVYYKGAEYLVRAMNSLPDAQLVLVGKGKLLPEIEALARQGPGNCAIIPYLSDEDLAAMYKACTLFVLPSVEKTEAFGIVQLEAMANGKPVITSDLETGVTYVNQDGKTGLVVPRRDSEALAAAIRTLLDDAPLRERLGAYARARALRDFTVAGMVQNTLRIYEELLA